MFCINCGAQVEDGKKFCPFCGSPLEQSEQQSQGNDGSQAQQQFDQQYNNQQYNQQYDQQQYNDQQFNFASQAPQPMMYGNNFGITERNIGLAILFSILTCGLYFYYWMICITEDTNKLSGDPNATSGGMVILLSLVTCGIYTYFWMYKRGEILDNYSVQRGLPRSSNAVLYLVLTFFGLHIVAYCLMQNELNKISHGL